MKHCRESGTSGAMTDNDDLPKIRKGKNAKGDFSIKKSAGLSNNYVLKHKL